jgi:anthranilate synthase component 2
MKILILDNYDSFTYNLVHLIRQFSGFELEIHRNDCIALEDVVRFDKILLSPGPGIPSEAGIMMDLIRRYASSKSILGVCLGLQGIGECMGGTLHNLTRVMHGVATPCHVTDPSEKLFYGLPQRFAAGRYHSWVVDRSAMPSELKVTAEDPDGFVMALAHREYDVRGVQFHPESVLTEYGKEMIENWLMR